MQPPPGYNQPPQGQPNPQFQQQYQQPGYGPPPQYGMQQYPYYPPPKKGMPGWAWGLIIGGIVLFVIMPIMVLAAIPLITSNTREARRAEGDQLLKSARDAARVQYSKTGSAPARLSEFTLLYSFEGQYYRVDDTIRSTSTSGTITCTPVKTTSDGRGTIDFDWASGNSQVRWQ